MDVPAPEVSRTNRSGAWKLPASVVAVEGSVGAIYAVFCIDIQ